MRFLITLLLLFVVFISKAQVNVDSIFAFVDDHSQSNLKRVEALAKITASPSAYSIQELIKAIDRMAELAEDSQQTYILYCQNNALGNYFRYIGSTPLALELFERNNDISKKYVLMPEYLNIGLIYQDQGDYSTAEEYFDRSLQFGTKYGLNNYAFSIYLLARRQREKFPDSSNVLIDSAINIWKSLPFGPPDEVYNTNNREAGALPQAFYNKASEALNEGNIEQAIAFIKEMEHWVKMDSTGAGRLYWLKVDLFLRNSQLDSALYYARAALNYYEEPDDKGFEHKSYEARSNWIVSKVYYEMGNVEEAFRYFRNYEAISRQLKKNEGVRAIDLHKYQKEREQENLKIQQQNLKEQANKKIRSIIFLTVVILFLIIVVGLFSRLRYVRKTSAVIQKERDRSDNLLHNILPAEVAAELKEKGKSEARDFDNVTVLFTDFVHFTQMAAKLSAKELVDEINHCFEAFDGIITNYKLEKIKTIGDAYMAAGGLHVPRTSEPKDVVKAALEMQAFMLNRKEERSALGLASFDMRVGIHTGPVVAGIVGVKKFQYDIWGDTVNTASRIESNGETGKVNISQATYELLKDDQDFAFESRGKIEAKGKGEMEMWFVRFAG